jgi:hypothetical protein
MIINSYSFDEVYDIPKDVITKIKNERDKVRLLYYAAEENIVERRKLQHYVVTLDNIVNSNFLSTHPDTIAFINNFFPESVLVDIFKQKFPINLKKFRAKYELQSDDMPAALQSKNEILIHGKYIAVSYILWPEVKKLL